MKTKKEELEAELTRLNALRKQVKEKLKALPVLEVGKWYKGTFGFESLIFITEIENVGSYNRIHGYGFKFGEWNDLSHLFSNTEHEKSLVEATPQEVEQALIEEAKRRGFNAGVYFSSTISENGQPRLIERISDWYYDSLKNSLHVCTPETEWHSNQSNPRIFQDGKWAAIIEQDKFAELKEAHRNGAVIESMPKKWIGDWTVATNPIWDGDNYEYRIKPEEKPEYFNLTQLTEIVKEQTKAMKVMNERLIKVESLSHSIEKPEEKPKVGDVCKFWNEYDDVFIVGIYDELRDRDDQWDDNNTHIHGIRLGVNYYTTFFKHAKPLTKQEAIDLLFNKGAN